ncbi:MAG: hypothetical protein IPK76_14725 [Lewinellaceae bacterium]|nr:hypothetical protein [Lewinellaceae bacterium]
MSTPAFVMMFVSNLLIIGVTGYYFWRVLTIAPPDSVDEDEANYPRGG